MEDSRDEVAGVSSGPCYAPATQSLISLTALTRMTVAQLKHELQKRNCSRSGAKSVLQERLRVNWGKTQVREYTCTLCGTSFVRARVANKFQSSAIRTTRDALDVALTTCDSCFKSSRGTRACIGCGKTFVPKTVWSVYCCFPCPAIQGRYSDDCAGYESSD